VLFFQGNHKFTIRELGVVLDDVHALDVFRLDFADVVDAFAVYKEGGIRRFVLFVVCNPECDRNDVVDCYILTIHFSGCKGGQTCHDATCFGIEFGRNRTFDGGILDSPVCPYDELHDYTSLHSGLECRLRIAYVLCDEISSVRFLRRDIGA